MRAEGQNSLRQQGRRLDPFPVSPKGKAGAGAFPPRRQNTAAPPTRGQAPLCDPPRTIEDFLLIQAAFSWKPHAFVSGFLNFAPQTRLKLMFFVFLSDPCLGGGWKIYLHRQAHSRMAASLN